MGQSLLKRPAPNPGNPGPIFPAPGPAHGPIAGLVPRPRTEHAYKLYFRVLLTLAMFAPLSTMAAATGAAKSGRT